MAKVCPQMKDASSEAKNAMAFATSSGRPGLPSGCILSHCFKYSRQAIGVIPVVNVIKHFLFVTDDEAK
jgi:hypothetical protein